MVGSFRLEANGRRFDQRQVRLEKAQEPGRSDDVRSQDFCALTQAAVRCHQCDLIGRIGCIGNDLDKLVIAAAGSVQDRHRICDTGFYAIASPTFQNHNNG